MKNPQIRRSLVTAFLLLLAAGCSSAPDPAPGASASAGFPRTVALPGGGSITIPKKPTRICSVTVGTDEILLELVGPERMVALSYLVDDPSYSTLAGHVPPGLARVTSEAEQIIGLEPDLVLVAFYSRAEFVQLLEEAGLPVVRLEDFKTLDDIEENIELLGRLTGEEKKAEELVNGMRKVREEVAERVSGRPPREVVAITHGWVAGKGTITTEIIELAGGRNLAVEKGIEGHKQVSVEALLEWDPEFLLVAGPKPARTHGKELVAQNPLFANLTAVKEGRVIEIPSAHLFSSASQHIVKGIEELARLLHPEAFESPTPVDMDD